MLHVCFRQERVAVPVCLANATPIALPGIFQMQQEPPERKVVEVKFRKKPVVIEAVQFIKYNVGSEEAIRNFYPHIGYEWLDGALERFIIHTLEGDMKLESGDFLIKGVKGEFYPCKPDIFEATYEPVN